MNLEIFLRPHWNFLCENTTNISAILNILYSKEILSRAEIELIKNRSLSVNSHEGYDCLYCNLVRKNLEPEILKQIWLDTSNDHIMNKIWTYISSIGEDFKFWNVGPRNDHYTGRREIFKILENHVESKNWEISTLKFVFYGMGGVGKTSIVKEFLYRNRNKFSNIFWFGAETSLVQQICQLAKETKFDNNESNDNLEIAQNFIKNWLDTKIGWLIVYDNVENFEDIRHFIPRLGGILLATSRNTTYWQGFNEISIENFEKSESCHFIQKILINGKNEVEQFEYLSEDLGYLPLAISIACYHIRLNSTTVQEYRNYLKIAEEEFLKICPKFEEKSVWKSVRISLDKMKKECHLAFKFLQIISFLQADEIPKLILEEFLEYKEIDPMRIIKIQKFLLKYDLVKLESRGEHQLYSIHRLVQKSIRIISVKNEYQILQDGYEIIKRVCAKNTALDTKYILQHAIQLLLNLMNFVQKSINVDDNRKLQILNRNIIDLIVNKNFYRWLSEIKDFDKIFHKYFDTVEKILVDLKDINELYRAMAECFRAKKDFPNALLFYEKVLVLSRENFGEFSTETSTVYNNFGLCYSDLLQFVKALEFFEKSLKIVIQLHGVDSCELILKYNNLGNIYLTLEEYKKASENLDKGLKLVQKHQVMNSYEASLIFINLGYLSFRLCDLENSRISFKQCLKVVINIYGESSRQVILKLKAIGDSCVYWNPSFALEFYRELSDFESKFHNGPSQETLYKIHICSQKITSIKEKSCFSKFKKMFSFN